MKILIGGCKSVVLVLKGGGLQSFGRGWYQPRMGFEEYCFYERAVL